ncbi:MAG: ATP-dependent Clp protease ATP-binding subunit, partial [Sphingobacteriaceae bacterium]
FNSLGKDEIFRIIDIELAALFNRVHALGYNVELTLGAKEFIADKGYDSQFGARPLKRAIQKYLEDPIAEEILKGELSEGALMEVDYDAETKQITINAKPAEVATTSEEEQKGE